MEVDSAAFTDIYGLSSNAYKQGIKVKSLDEYASIELQLSGLQAQHVVVQLLKQTGDVVLEVPCGSDGSALFEYVVPDKYFARLFVDRNGNGVWDTGDYDADQQPEEVYYYPREIEAKAKWDITQQWNVTEQKRINQKPSRLVKQKGGKEKRQRRNRNLERAKQLGIEYIKR